MVTERPSAKVPALPLFEHAQKRESDDEKILRVAELNRIVKRTLESGFGDIWVEGELSDVTRAASGHVYFTLNDGKDPAQIRGVIFRNDARRAKAKLEDGERVKLRGGVSLYEARGSYQLIARLALPAGIGDLHAEFERIRQKLEAEGLIDPARRRPLPTMPKTVGVVTSMSGAAMHDIIRVARGRSPTRIVVSHCLVQGQEAPLSIVQALRAIQRLPDLDVVIIGRGGGSSEDLFAFNDERVAREIANCRVPIVSAVGHEVDVTIADLVADLRAATPSNAAELVVPDRRALQNDLTNVTRAMERAMDLRFGRERMRKDRIVRRLADPRRRIAVAKHQLAAFNAAILKFEDRRIKRERARLAALYARLIEHDARTRLARDKATLTRFRTALEKKMVAKMQTDRRAFGEVVARLDALSPLSVLGRGYAIALAERSGKAITRSTDVEVGEALTVRVSEGSLRAIVESKNS